MLINRNNGGKAGQAQRQRIQRHTHTHIGYYRVTHNTGKVNTQYTLPNTHTTLPSTHSTLEHTRSATTVRIRQLNDHEIASGAGRRVRRGSE